MFKRLRERAKAFVRHIKTAKKTKNGVIVYKGANGGLHTKAGSTVYRVGNNKYSTTNGPGPVDPRLQNMNLNSYNRGQLSNSNRFLQLRMGTNHS